jgi:hypothetical protein
MSGGYFLLRGENKVSENNPNDMIYNWRNELKSHHDGAYVVASSQAQKLKNQGFDKSEIVELLAADNYDLDLANRVASKLFDDTSVQETNSVVEVSVVPTKYSDCAPIIEKTLSKVSAREFAKRLCSGSYAIVKTDDRGLNYWHRMAELAQGSSVGMKNLHSALKPHVEETLLNSVLIAQSQEAEVKTASKNKYVVSMRKGSADVDLSNATSTSEKFTLGNYSSFGLADEFMVKAADTVSPYARLKRALRD